MLKKFYTLEFIKDLSKSITDIIYESIGTLLLNKDESILINLIYNDINDKKYHKLKPSEYKDIHQLTGLNDIYSLKYNINDFNKKYNTHIKWILNLEILVSLTDNPNLIDAAALLDSNTRTIFSDDNIIYACIIINNPEHERFPKNYIAHELNHYYSEFNRYKKTKLYPVYSDIDINYTYPHYSIDYSNFDRLKLMLNNNNAYLKSILLDVLYWLNESEIKAHIENIYYELELNLNNATCNKLDDISKYSETLNHYRNIDKVLHYIYDNISEDQTQYLNNSVIPLFKVHKTFDRKKRLNINYIFKKMFNKLNKIYKHIHRMYIYLHTL